MIKLLEKLAKPWEMEIVRSMRERPEEWQKHDYTIDHISGIRIWLSNGLPFHNLYAPFSSWITWSGKLLIGIEANNIKHGYVVKKIKGNK